MNRKKMAIIVLVTSLLTLTLLKTARPQTQSETETFFEKMYTGLFIQVNATREALPGENITLSIIVNCRADDVYVHYLNITVYGYEHYKYGLNKTHLFFNCVLSNTSLTYNNIIQRNYTIGMPQNVWDIIYAELHLKHEMPQFSSTNDEVFPITTVKNTVWEELDKKIEALNKTLSEFNQLFYMFFGKNLSSEALAELNSTMWKLQHDYESLRGDLNELDNTRRLAAILAITTVFFVATTMYLVLKKPKEYW